MPALSQQEKETFMRRALQLSRNALPGCRPNPPVGCVLARAGAIVAEGFTQSPGSDHAEAAALRQYPGPLDSLTVFVTLEPCSFVGRTPSCARSLAKRGARHVVVSLIDPDPRNRGAGIAILESAGAMVEVGILEDEVRAFLHPYLSNAAEDR